VTEALFIPLGVIRFVKIVVFYIMSSCVCNTQEETADKMSWLNQIKLSHGSVEENALMIARAVNKKAKICVGHINCGDSCRAVFMFLIYLKLKIVLIPQLPHFYLFV